MTGTAPGGKPASSPSHKPTSPPGNSASNPHGGPPGITGSAHASPSGGSGDEDDTSTVPPDEGNTSTVGDENGTSTPADEGNGGGANSGAESNGNAGGNGHAGKVTLCHATASLTNPFVNITISVNGLNGHADHQDGEDIIPVAPGEECPAGVSPTAGASPDHANEHPDKVTICHATGSETNPFVVITISVNGLNGHDDHQNGEDVIPAPESGDCASEATPTLAVSPLAGGSGPGSGLSPLTVSAVLPLAEEAPGHGVLGEHGSGGSNSPKLSSGVEAVNSSGTSPSADTGDTPASPKATGTGDTKDHGLPFTGLDVLGLLAVGAMAIGLGLLLRRLARRPA